MVWSTQLPCRIIAHWLYFIWRLSSNEITAWNLNAKRNNVTLNFISKYLSHDMTKPTCVQRRLRSESSLSAWRNLGSLATHWAHSKDTNQTGRMPRLIWVFAGRIVTLLVLSCRGSFVNEQYYEEGSLGIWISKRLIHFLSFVLDSNGLFN